MTKVPAHQRLDGGSGFRFSEVGRPFQQSEIQIGRSFLEEALPMADNCKPFRDLAGCGKSGVLPTRGLHRREETRR
jgi:hypothetical protein